MQFIDFALSYGLEIKSPCPTDRIQRCGTVEHPKGKNGAYYWDGKRGWVCNWEADAQTRWHDTDRPWSEAQKQAFRRRQQINFEAQERKYETAAKTAQAILRQAALKEHDYLIRKGFPDEKGLVTADNALLIPMRNVRTHAVQGLQEIRWVDMAWQKKMMPGMRAKNAVFRTGSQNAPETVFCEGYATGLSIAQAARMSGLNLSVVVCFSASNMVAVADQMPGRKYVYADNDVSGTGEAKAKETGLPYCMSGVVGNDANDEHVQFGLMAVAQKLMEVRLSQVHG